VLTDAKLDTPDQQKVSLRELCGGSWEAEEVQPYQVPEEDDLAELLFNHSFRLRVLRAVLYAGTSVILQNGFAFAKELENNIDAYHCTGTASVPASIEMFLKQSFIGFGFMIYSNPLDDVCCKRCILSASNTTYSQLICGKMN